MQAKLYLSIIDDVIENMKELFQDEGLEDRVLDDLRQVRCLDQDLLQKNLEFAPTSRRKI